MLKNKVVERLNKERGKNKREIGEIRGKWGIGMAHMFVVFRFGTCGVDLGFLFHG